MTNISKLNFFKNLINNLIVKYEIKNENKMPVKFIKEISILSLIIIFCKLYTLTIANTGRDVKKDIFAESILLYLSILALVIVIPDLLTPGINDKI